MRRVMAVGVAAVVGVALWVVPTGAATRAAASSESTKDAATILADAKAATGSAKTVRISGTVTDAGKTTTLNVVSSKGAGGGTIGRDGATILVVVRPPNVYLRANAASWAKLVGTPAAGQLLGGKWLQTTTQDSDFGSFAKLLDASVLADSISSNGALTKGDLTTYHGTKAIPLVDADQTGTLYVAASGKPYILGIVGSGSKQGSEIQFTKYNSATTPSAPKHSVNVADLERKGSAS